MGKYTYNMIRQISFFILLILLAASPLKSETTINPNASGVTGTKHNLSMYGPGAIRSISTTEICVFCHTPHNSRPNTPIWNKQDPGTTYTIYGTATLTVNNTMGQPTGSSRLCLSCHDGTIAIGSLLNAPGAILAQTLEMQGVDSGTGALLSTSAANVGTNLSNDHPISFLYSASYPANSEIKDPGTNNVNIAPAVLKSGSVQCASCHDPHTKTYPKFLRAALNPASGDYGSALCILCHDKDYWDDTNVPVHREDDTYTWTGSIINDANPWEPNDLGAAVPSTTLSSNTNASAVTIPVVSTAGFLSSGRIGIDNELIDYTGTTADSFTGATRGAAGTIAGSYLTGAVIIGNDYGDDTLKMHGCLSCHRSHGGALGKQLQKGRDGDDVNRSMVGEEWSCLNCHNGSMTNGTDNIKNIEAVVDADTSTNKHDIKGVEDLHKSERFATDTPPVREDPDRLNNNRHAKCQDCHNPHGAKSGNHTVGGATGNRIGSNLIGAWGVQPTWAGAGIESSTYTTLQLNDPASSFSYESYLCIKCHSSYAYGVSPPQLNSKFPNFPGTDTGYESDPTADFNINNFGYHPVFENTGKNQPVPTTLNPNWPVNSLGLTNTFRCVTLSSPDNCTTVSGPDVAHQSTMTCSDCHGNSNFATTDPKGLHGSANKYILRSNETSTGSTKNFCYNCHRRDVYGDEAYCDPATENTVANYSRVTHPPDYQGKTAGVCNSPFYRNGANVGNDSNHFGILCLSCHGGGEKTQNGNNVIDGIHGSHTGIGGNGNYGADELGKRLMNGSCLSGHTHATNFPAVGVTLWFKNDLSSDKVCKISAPYGETGAQCNNNTDDDAGDGGAVNDGCPTVGIAAEADAQCNNNTDDDGDGTVNDGCPSVYIGSTANYDYWPSPWP